MSFLTNWWRSRRAARMARERELVADVLRAERDLTARIIAERARLGPGGAYVALAAMEYDGSVTGRWVDGPYPRRRVYRLAPPRTGGAR